MTRIDGECILTSHYDSHGHITGLTVERADPKVLISPELLDEMASNPPDYPATFDGEVLRIRGINRTVVYRITGRVDNGDGWSDPCYIGEWPD